MLLVEQNARSALGIADQGIVLNLGKVVARPTRPTLAADEGLRRTTWVSRTGTGGRREAGCRSSLSSRSAGSAPGMIYAAIALSLVLIWRGTRVLNYSQGGMAMFTTYIALIVINHTGNYWLGFVVALASGLVLGAVLERTVVRPTKASRR